MPVRAPAGSPLKEAASSQNDLLTGAESPGVRDEEGTVRRPSGCQESTVGNRGSFSRSKCRTWGPCFILTAPSPPCGILSVNAVRPQRWDFQGRNR